MLSGEGSVGHDRPESVDGLVYPADEFPALCAVFILARSVVGVIVSVEGNADGHNAFAHLGTVILDILPEDVPEDHEGRREGDGVGILTVEHGFELPCILIDVAEALELFQNFS